MKTHMTELAASFDLTPSQVAALRHLDDARSQRDLAGCLHVDASNVTDIVDRLEEHGLVVRTVDPHDRRVRRIVVTPEGEELRTKLFEQALATAPMRSPLNLQEQQTLCELLGRIAEPAGAPLLGLGPEPYDQRPVSSSVVVILATSESVFLMITSV